MAKNKKEEYKEQNLLFLEETASQEFTSCRVAYYIRYWSRGRVLFRPN